MLNNLIPVARIIKLWTELSKIENATQVLCNMLRAKLMKQKACMLPWDLLHHLYSGLVGLKFCKETLGTTQSAAQLSISQCLACCLDILANCLIYICTVS